jgi:hypothetical protein
MICSRLQSRVARDLRFEGVTSKLLHDAVNHHMRFFFFEESLWATPYHLTRQRSIDRRPPILTYCLHLQNDDGGSMHLWNVSLLRDLTALYPRKLSSWLLCVISGKDSHRLKITFCFIRNYFQIRYQNIERLQFHKVSHLPSIL